MALLLLHALLLASAAAATALDNATSDGSNYGASPVLCNGVGCEPPAQPLPIYGYYPPPAAPSLPSAPPTPPSSPGSQTPCPPVAIVCCGGADGQYMPQQPHNNAPPNSGYVPYYNTSASPPALLAPVAAGYDVMVLMAACLVLQLVVL